jgi:hypothetical protein
LLTAARSLRRAAVSGHALPRVAALADLYNRGVEFRQSQLWMMTGRPKAGKSFVAQWLGSEWAKAAKQQGTTCRGIYFFMDGTPFTAAVRQAAWVTGHQTKDIAAALDGPGQGFYEDALEEVSSDITFVYDKKPELPAIQESIDAYTELWDEYPDWMIFDNLRNLAGGDEGHEAKKFTLSELQALAYQTRANVGVLHHASESGVRDYSRPPRVGDTEDKVSQYPEMVLTVAKDPNSDRFLIAVGAQRDGGDSDPAAEHPITLFADLSRVSFTNVKPMSAPAWGGWENEHDDD